MENLHLITEIKKILSRNINAKMVVFMRHAEKSQDVLGCLTPKGIQDCVFFAESLKRCNVPIVIYCSPELRCRETANVIRQQTYNNAVVTETNFLGAPGAQILNEKKYLELYKNNKCRDIYAQWKMGAYQNFMASPEQLRQKSKSFFSTLAQNNGINLCISQSGTVACVGYALGCVDYDVSANEWVSFLDGFVKELT